MLDFVGERRKVREVKISRTAKAADTLPANLDYVFRRGTRQSQSYLLSLFPLFLLLLNDIFMDPRGALHKDQANRLARVWIDRVINTVARGNAHHSGVAWRFAAERLRIFHARSIRPMQTRLFSSASDDQRCFSGLGLRLSPSALHLQRVSCIRIANPDLGIPLLLCFNLFLISTRSMQLPLTAHSPSFAVLRMDPILAPRQRLCYLSLQARVIDYPYAIMPNTLEWPCSFDI